MNDREYVEIFLDKTKLFNNVKHSILKAKLELLGIRETSLKLLNTDRKQKSKIINTYSNYRVIS